MAETKIFGGGNGPGPQSGPLYEPPVPREPPPSGSSLFPWTLVVILVVVLGGGAWFGSELVGRERAKAKEAAERVQAAEDKANALDLQRGELALKAEELEKQKDSLARERDSLTQQVQAQESELARLKATYESLEAKMNEEIARGDVALTQEGARIRVELVDKILFDSGEAALSERGAEVLGRLGTVLAGVNDKQIQVSGHTDDTPISDKLVGQFPTNWELSVARAVNVVRFLSEKGGVKPGKLVAAGYGPYEPVASNKTAKGRARNRRIEILLTPELEAKKAATK